MGMVIAAAPQVCKRIQGPCPSDSWHTASAQETADPAWLASALARRRLYTAWEVGYSLVCVLSCKTGPPSTHMMPFRSRCAGGGGAQDTNNSLRNETLARRSLGLSQWAHRVATIITPILQMAGRRLTQAELHLGSDFRKARIPNPDT